MNERMENTNKETEMLTTTISSVFYFTSQDAQAAKTAVTGSFNMNAGLKKNKKKLECERNFFSAEECKESALLIFHHSLRDDI